MKGKLLFSLIPLIAFALEPKVITVDDTKNIPFPGHGTKVMAHAHDTEASTAVMELHVPAKTFGAPPHIHTKEDEYFYVLEGEVKFLERDKTVLAKKDTLLVMPRGHLHGFWNKSERDARLLLIVSPGKFASFFDEVVANIRKTNSNNPEKIAMLIAQAAAKRGVDIKMDKIPSSVKPLLAPRK